MRYVTIFFFILCFSLYGQRIALHTITNVNVDTDLNKYSFDIYSKSTGGTSIRVGLTSYYINFNSLGLANPILSNVNSKYTTGSPTGDYDELTVEIVGGTNIAVTIWFSGDGDGIGDVLSTDGENGERIATVTLDITNSELTAGISWNEIDSGMITPTFQLITNNYQGSDDSPLPVELTMFSHELVDGEISLFWETATEVNNFGFDVERGTLNTDSTKEWYKLGFVEGAGTSNSPKSYEFIDSYLPDELTVWYRLKQIDNDGKYTYTKSIEVDLSPITSVEEFLPTQYSISQNYPNPFNPSTVIRYTIPEDSRVKLEIYNSIGQKVRTIIDNQIQAGYHEVKLNANDFSSGVYFFRIQAGSFIETKKMLLIK
ncbi:MAG: T9SS type A sorting domain-containing protein [Melioribacteraceae bacterium]|nr:MAG: T9SS type A sorting domain-containing protein [Melioribacteraceae bacterium]